MANPEILKGKEELKEIESDLHDLKETVVRQWPKLTQSAWRINWPSGQETYYNMDMSGVINNFMKPLWYTMKDYRVREDGVKMLWKYVMVAANQKIRPRWTILRTSLWKWIVCDTWSFASTNPKQLDIAVNWGREVRSKKTSSKKKSKKK